MKSGEVRVVTPGVDRRRRIIYLIPLFVAAVVIGFLLELSTYETLTLADIRLAFVHLPQRFSDIRNWQSSQTYLNPIDNTQEELAQQLENETVFIDEIISSIPSTTPLPYYAEPNLLDLPHFEWISNNASICRRRQEDNDPSNPYRLLPVLVHTSRTHFAERLALRRTWGSVPVYKRWDLRFIFLLGEQDRGNKPHLNDEQYNEQLHRLGDEMDTYGDIVVGSFTDSYHNLTYKHLMGYKWILNFCHEAEFVLKIDDDMFIDILRFLDWRSEDLDKPKGTKIPELYCHTFGGTKPIRERGSKWYASVEDWPDEWYPDYCSGWAYLITVSLLEKLYSVSNHIKFFWVDDVFATGALMEVVKKELRYHPEIRHIWGEVTGDIADWRGQCQEESWDKPRGFKAVVYVPRGEFFERDMQCMWNKTLHDMTNRFEGYPIMHNTQEYKDLFYKGGRIGE